MTVLELREFYTERQQHLRARLAAAGRSRTLSGLVLIAAAVAIGGITILSLREGRSPFWAIAPLPVAIGALHLRTRSTAREDRDSRLADFYARGSARLAGTWHGTGPSGAGFEDPCHPYASDLNILGASSLFQLLCTTRTAIGQRGLAAYLLSPPSLAESVARREAVCELAPQTQLREQIAVLGNFAFSESTWESFAQWLDSEVMEHRNRIRIAAWALLAVLLVFLVLGIALLLPWSVVLPSLCAVLLLRGAIGLFCRSQVQEKLAVLRSVAAEISVLREGLGLLALQSFQSAKLQALQQQVTHSVASLGRLERLLRMLYERDKDWFYGPSLFLLFATQLCLEIEVWRDEHRAELRVWLDAWAEFEALHALANYAFENPDHAAADLVPEEELCFEASAIGHPLLARDVCVRNDVQLNRGTRFHLVSGSNMSGKSTLLRAIGLNLVLARSGAPVCARTLRMSALSVATSLSASDSLAEGRSRFRAEIEKLSQILAATTQRPPVLFLIDEIFAGTNSKDRRIAAEAVVRTLIERGAIGALSTHDLALTELADAPELHGANLHMGSAGNGDPMEFDYILKSGITNESNALEIARLAGVPV
ncbi:MutS-related protein [Bryobacter aggregatus]|uniref:MutS-related protein n=1 Tax=Bryobacter aggregatus TaxID=360054 RepID=UPI000AA6F224|nr:hypothetical protein [Bryobacter aggregatus]